MSTQYYMYITSSLEAVYPDSLTRYITTLEGFPDLLVSEDFTEESYDCTEFQSITKYSFAPPEEDGDIAVTITGIDYNGNVHTIERGLITVKMFK